MANQFTEALRSSSSAYTPQDIAAALNPRELELIILPTEHCNFRCTYCYEDFAIGRMRPRTVNAIKKLLAMRMPDLDSVRLSWFGGEPLLAKSVCLDIARYAKDLAQQFNVTLSGFLTTNASLLTVPLLKELVALDQRGFQISLDGDPEAHNRTRIKANGAGTFELIWNNLIEMSKTDLNFDVNLRLHLSPDSVQSQERLVLMINEQFGGDERFAITFHGIENLGGPTGGTFGILSNEEHEKAISRLRKLVHSGNRVSSDLDFHSSYICYASKPNSLLIRANGRLAKCTVAFNDPRNDIGYLRDDGTLSILNERFALWLEGFRDLNPGRLACPLHELGKDPLEFKGIPIVTS